jgi:hypothetical protein
MYFCNVAAAVFVVIRSRNIFVLSDRVYVPAHDAMDMPSRVIIKHFRSVFIVASFVASWALGLASQIRTAFFLLMRHSFWMMYFFP